MDNKIKDKWNKKYLESKHIQSEPSEILKNYYLLAKRGKALDVACGTGRNAIFLANKGFYVDAVDISDVAIDILKNNNEKNINAIVADLDNYNFEENNYELVVNINFLNREIINSLKKAIKPNGIIIFETFLISEKRKNKQFYLEENELLRMFLDFRIIFYEEKYISQDEPKAYLVAKKKC